MPCVTKKFILPYYFYYFYSQVEQLVLAAASVK
jgi:hypothetical protein